MSKLHITLAKNMSRFGTKNLTEANKRSLQYLAEQENVPGKKPVSTITPVEKPALDADAAASNYTPFVDAAKQIGRGYIVSIPLGSEPKYGPSVLALSDATHMRDTMMFKSSGNKMYATYAVVGAITIDLAKGTLIHNYHYQYGQASPKPLEFMKDKQTGQPIGQEYSYEKTYKFVAGDISDYSKQLATLKSVLEFIISDGPVKSPNVGKLTNIDFYNKMKSIGYTATFKGV